MPSNKSCLGCKYLYSHGRGYSNYTWEDTEIKCALELNNNLPADQPYDWSHRHDKETNLPDNWPKTNNARCNKYVAGNMVELDIDSENGPADFTNDKEVIVLIGKQCNRNPQGGWKDFDESLVDSL